MRVVFDTNTVISALLFGGSLHWFIMHWQSGLVTPLVSQASAEELLRVLGYPKFGLSADKIERIASRYLSFAERVEKVTTTPNIPLCRDNDDQKFIDLAIAGHADVLVSGDADLHALRDVLPFAVEAPAMYCRRFENLTGL
jgi:putative PIN family toxin of toxin-antitoxin system